MQGIYGDLSEAEIIDAFHEGREHIFKAVFTTYSGGLYYFCYDIIGHQQEAQDIVSESFVKLYEHKNTVSEIDRIRGLLYTIAENLCLNYLRNIKRRTIHQQTILHTLQTVEDSIVSYIVKAENRRQLHQAIAMLPPRRQYILKEIINNGKTVRELAIELNISEQAVYSAKDKALQTLRVVLDKGATLVIIVLLYILLTIIDLAKRHLFL